MTRDADPDHPIVDRPWRYAIRSLCDHVDPDGSGASHVDLTLVRGEIIRRLRFRGPQRFAIEAGCFPEPTGGMRILDVRHRQLEGLNVLVDDFEGTRGGVTFWARDVIDLDDDAGPSTGP